MNLQRPLMAARKRHAGAQASLDSKQRAPDHNSFMVLGPSKR